MIRYGNRGQRLEDLIEQANEIYLRKNKAVISKIPTPWKVQRKYSPYSKSYQISNAFPEKKSTVDFGGTANFHSIWFDVKSTKNKTSFPLKNIHKHQVEYLEKVAKQGGKAFFLIHSEYHRKTWILWIDQFFAFTGQFDRKSIPFEWFETNCETIPKGTGVALDYLPVVLKRKENKT